MSGNTDKGRERPEPKTSIQFFGAVTASVSHELNNVISIIDQTAGLVEDMIIGEQNGVPISLERLGSAVTTMRKQTERGLDIIRRLNRFAHSSDYPNTDFDLNEIVQNLVHLTQRLASLKRAQLVFSASPEPLVIVSDPFLLQQILFRLIRRVLNTVEREGIIELDVRGAAGQVEVNVTSVHCREQEDLVSDELSRQAEKLGARLEVRSGEEKSTISLVLPVSASDSAGNSG
jgi:signal transduction histidine kinase